MNDYYSVIMDGKYLQGVEPNAEYVPMSKAPTMGRRHDSSEFSTVWSKSPKLFERLTVIDYVRTLLEEFRWGDIKPHKFVILPMDEEILGSSEKH